MWGQLHWGSPCRRGVSGLWKICCALLLAFCVVASVWACDGTCGPEGCAGGFGCGCGCGVMGNSLDNRLGGGHPGGQSAYNSQNIQLRGHLSMQQMSLNNNPVLGSAIWGWHDEETGREYAIYGKENGTAFVDVTDPANLRYLGDLPTQTGNSIWREVQTYKNYLYVVSDSNGAHGVQIFDLRNLRGVTTPTQFSNTAHFRDYTVNGVDTLISNVHTLSVNEATGHLYLNGSNQRWGGYFALSLENPLQPQLVGFNYVTDSSAYIHDGLTVIYQGLDSRFVGREIAFNSMGFHGLSISDVTVKDKDTLPSQVELSRSRYKNLGYTHQAWLTEDHRFLVMNDEFDELLIPGGSNTLTHLWELADLTAPRYLGAFDHGRVAIDHNLFIKGNLVYMSNYSDGLRVYDLSRLPEVASGMRPVSAALELVGYFDTYFQDDASPEVSFNGSWGNYPFLPSGNILVGDRQNGLFVLSLGSNNAAPEPATFALCLLGGGVWWQYRRVQQDRK